MRVKKVLSLIVIIGIVFGLLPTPFTVPAYAHETKGYWFNSPQLLNIQNENTKEEWTSTEGYVGDGARYNRALENGDKYQVFFSTSWNKGCLTYDLSCTKENTTRTAIYIEKGLWDNLKTEYNDRPVIPATLDRIYQVGMGLWAHSELPIEIQNPAYYKPPHDYGLYYNYSPSELDKSGGLKIESAFCGTFTREGTSKTFYSQECKITVDRETTKTPLPEYTKTIYKKDGMGNYRSVATTPIRIYDPIDPNAAKKDIVGIIYVDKVCAECKAIEGAADVTVTAEPGNLNVLLNRATATYTFPSLPYGQKYTVSIKQKIDATWEDWIGRISPDEQTAEEYLSHIIAGDNDYYLEGSVEFELNDKGIPTAIGSREPNQGPFDMVAKLTTITTEDKIESIFNGAIKDAIKSVLLMINSGLETGSKWINDILIEGNDLEDQTGVKEVWISTRNITLSLLTLGILIIAFMNILGLDLQTYGLGRMLPRLIIGIVFTYFSFLISNFLLDMTSAFQALLFGQTKGNYFSISSMASTVVDPSAVDTISAVGTLLMLALFGVALFLVVLWLCLILVVRTAMLYVLVGIGPIAFMAYILPFTEKYYKQWWAAFWRWAFMGPAVAFMLWLSQKFLIDGYYKEQFSAMDSSKMDTWIWLIAAGVMLWLAATLPLKMGKEIYGSIMKGIKNTAPAKMVKEGWNQRQSRINQRRTDSVRNLQRTMALKGGVAGRLATGVGLKKGATDRLREENIAEIQKKLAPLKGNFNGLHQGLLKTRIGSDEEAAYLREIAEGGATQLDWENPEHRRVMERWGSAVAKGTPGVLAAAGKLKDTLYPALYNHGLGGKQAEVMAGISVSGMDKNKINKHQAEYLSNNDKAAANFLKHFCNQENLAFFEKSSSDSAKEAMGIALDKIIENKTLPEEIRRTASSIKNNRNAYYAQQHRNDEVLGPPIPGPAHGGFVDEDD